MMMEASTEMMDIASMAESKSANGEENTKPNLDNETRVDTNVRITRRAGDREATSGRGK